MRHEISVANGRFCRKEIKRPSVVDIAAQREADRQQVVDIRSHVLSLRKETLIDTGVMAFSLFHRLLQKRQFLPPFGFITTLIMLLRF